MCSTRMGGGTPAKAKQPLQAAAGTSVAPESPKREPKITKGPHSLSELVAGCKVFVTRQGEPKPLKSEILSLRENKHRARLAKASPEADLADSSSLLDYYIHYVGWNKVRSHVLGGSWSCERRSSIRSKHVRV